MRRLRFGVLGLMLTAAALAGAVQASARDAAARLLSIGAETGDGAHAMVIEASEPVAFAVTRPDLFTVLVDLRDVRVANAKNHFRPSNGTPVSAVVIDEMTTPDGAPLTRVMMQLKQPLQHTATANKGKIRIEFASSTGSGGSTGSTGSVPGATVLSSVSAAGSGAPSVAPVARDCMGASRPSGRWRRWCGRTWLRTSTRRDG